VAEPVIQCSSLTRSFGELVAVDQFDLTVEAGTIYGFLGPNGCGKSTVMRLLCGLLLPSSGDIDVLGHQIPRDVEVLRNHIGYMPQKNALYTDLTVEENLQFMAGVYLLNGAESRARIKQLLNRYGLGDFAKARVGNLSGGQRQKAALALATLHQPPLLILDEPTSEVDPQSRREFWASLFELVAEGSTILVSTHFMDEAERCHRLAVLDQGKKIVDDSPENLMAAVDAHVLRVDCAQPMSAAAALHHLPGVISVAQIGQHLRVMLSRQLSEPGAVVSDHLADAGLSAELESQSPNLEDVFVAATWHRGGHE
jgi:ABC-2 type transport system ATP-binding protein